MVLSEFKRELLNKRRMIILAHNLNKIKTKRSGVIPYAVIHKKLYFLLGIDRNTGDADAFAGGVKEGETALIGAIREFKEETLELFSKDYYDINKFTNSIAIMDDQKDTSLIFLCVNKKWVKQAEHKFKQFNFNRKSEMCNVVWLDEQEFSDAIFNRQNNLMWKKTQKFFMRTVNWTKKKELLQMLRSVRYNYY